MRHESSYRGRRIVGQLEAGEEVVSALTRLCQDEGVRAGEVRISGVLRRIELAKFSRDDRDYRVEHRGGPVEILHLHGTIGVIGDAVIPRLDAMVLAETSFGTQIVGGQVRSATAESGELILEVFEDLEIVRGRERTTGHMILTKISSTRPAPKAPAKSIARDESPLAPTSTPIIEPTSSSPKKPELKPEPTRPKIKRPEALVEKKIEPAQEPAKPELKPDPKPVSALAKSQTTLSWGDVAARSEEISQPASRRASKSSDPAQIYAGIGDDEDDDFLPEMKRNDILEHPKLGRCKVESVEDEEYAFIRLPRGKRRKIVLEIFDIKFKGTENGHNVFTLRISK